MSNTLDQPPIDLNQFPDIQRVLMDFPQTAKDLKQHEQRKDFAMKQRGEKLNGPMTHSELTREYFDFLQFLFYQAMKEMMKSNAPQDVILEGGRTLDQLERNLYDEFQLATKRNHQMGMADHPVSSKALSL